MILSGIAEAQQPGPPAGITRTILDRLRADLEQDRTAFFGIARRIGVERRNHYPSRGNAMREEESPNDRDAQRASLRLARFEPPSAE